MENIIKIFDNPTYNDVIVTIQTKHVVDKTTTFLKTYNLEKKYKFFLIAFLIDKFPRDILGSFKDLTIEGIEIELTELDNDLQKEAKNFVEYCKSSNDFSHIENKLDTFILKFNDWKAHDKENLIETMRLQYYYLVINIMNAPEEIKKYLLDSKNKIINISKKVGGETFVNELLEKEKEILKELSEK